nr:MAG TPA: hypothetical protein [Caudoviricetes sp.]
MCLQNLLDYFLNYIVLLLFYELCYNHSTISDKSVPVSHISRSTSLLSILYIDL